MSANVALPDAGTTEPPRCPIERTARWLGVGVALAAFVVMLVPNLDLLRADVVVDGDPAANQLLIDQAARGQLLVGHYSRTQFHHPGPFFLYEQAVGEVLLHRWTSVAASPYAAHAVAVFALNAALLGWAAAIAFGWSRSVAVAVALPVLALVVNTWQPGLLTSSWMPAVMMVPFLFLLVTASSVGAGRWRDLPALAFALGATVHGHLTTALFACATAVVVATVLWWRHRRAGDLGRPRRADLVGAGVVLAVFALPIVLHTLTSFPGELRRYVGYARSGGGTNSVPEAAEFVRTVLFPGPVLGLVLVACVAVSVVARRRPDRLSHLLSVGLVLAGALGVLFVVFSVRGVDDPSLTYLGWFAFALPVFVLWIGWSSTWRLVASRNRRAAELVGVLAAAAIVVGVLATSSLAEPYRGVPQIRAMADTIEDPEVRLRYDQPSWPAGVAILVHLGRSGVRACVDDPGWEFMVTSRNVCADDDAGPVVWVAGPGDPREPGGQVLFDRDGYRAWTVDDAP